MIVLSNGQYWLNYLNQLPADKPFAKADLQCAAKALDMAAATPHAWPIVLPLALALHPHMERCGYWTEWGTFLEYLLYYARQYNDQKAETAFLIKLGSIQQQRGNHEAAIAAYREIWRKCRHIDRQMLAVTFSNLGDLYRLQRIFWRAEILCGHAITLFETLNDPLRVAYTENTVGLIYLDQRDWEVARRHFDRAESLFVQLTHLVGCALVWNNLGALYNYQQDSKQALTYLHRALEYYQQIQDQTRMARVYMNIGNALRKQGDLKTSEHNLILAETIFARIGHTADLARVRHNLGMLYTRLSQYAEAERCFQRALEQWRSREDVANYANTLGELADMYFVWGRWEIARQTLDTEDDLLKNHPEVISQTLYRELETRRLKLAPEI